MNDRARESDVVIIGAGATGAALCQALAAHGLEVSVIDAAQAADAGRSVRTSALSRASLQWLAQLGAQPAPDVEPAPLQALEVIDRDGRGRLRFDSSELGQEDLGVIVNHGLWEQALRRRAKDMAGVRWYTGRAEAIAITATHGQITLQDGRQVRAPLLVAADGAQSLIRERLGIPVLQYRYGQTALCADIRLERPHEGAAWQRFLASGPCALLPSPDPHRASLIWSADDREAARLQGLRDEGFAAALTQAFGSYLGQLELTGPRAYFPLTAAHARRYVGPRFALIGDAAHRVHPLAGQGVNLGLADARALAGALLTRGLQPADLGSLRRLRAYERERKGANVAMLCATTALNQMFRNDHRWLRDILAAGLNVTDSLGPLKTFFMIQAGARA